MADYYNNVIHKLDRKGKLLSIKDMTNDEWDITDYNNYRFEFVEYDVKTNRAIKRIPFFVDADEITAYLSLINTGKFSTIMDWHTFFAGGNARAVKKANGNMEKIVDGIESRKMTMGVNDSGYFVIKVEVGPGKKNSSGAVTPAGDTLESISFGISAKEAVVLAKTLESYTNAKKSYCMFNYMRNKKDAMKEEKSAV